MGYSNTLHNWQFLLEIIREKQLVLPGLKMAELGNQLIWADVLGLQKSIAARRIFEAVGVEYVSFDLNGLDGAFALDLCKPLPAIFHGCFDLVTNSGTSEHVKDQYRCFQNIHRLCRTGGVMWHCLPEVRSWTEHSAYVWYEVDHLAALAVACDYEVIQLQRFERNEGSRLYHLLGVAFQKRQDKFISRDQFEEIMPCLR